MLRLLRAAVLLVLVLPAGAQAQPVQQFRAGFDRDANRYRWTGEVDFIRAIGLWDVEVRNRFTSEALLLSSDLLSFRDENEARWRLSRPLTEGLTLGTRGHFNFFSQSDVQALEALAFARFAPRPDLLLEPAAGFALDQRPGILTSDGTLPIRTDTGPAFGLRTGWMAENREDAQTALASELDWQRIAPRQHHTARLTGTSQRQLGQALLYVEGGYVNLRRDGYQAASFLNREEDSPRRETTVEATTSDTLWASAAVSLPVSIAALDAPLLLDARLDAVLNRRFIRTLHAPDDALFFDTNYDRRAVDLGLDARYERGGLRLRAGAELEVGVEARTLANRAALPPAQAALKGDLLRQADLDQSRFTFRTEARLPLRSLTLDLATTSSILRHDTPEINDDDRDEVFHTARLALTWPASRYLALELGTFGSFYHTVYLRATRSAENNRRYSLRFQPAIRWHPSENTRLRLGTEVRATYTVDDFKIEGRQANDQSARELRYDLSWEQELAPTIRLTALGSYSDLRLGRLLWDSFSEIPSDTLRTYSGWVRLGAGPDWRAELGMRSYVRTAFRRAATVRYPRADENGDILRDDTGQPLLDTISRPGREWIVQLGPTAMLSFPLTGGSALQFDGWLQVQRITYTLYGRLPADEATRIRDAARRGTTRLIPNLAVSLVWAF